MNEVTKTGSNQAAVASNTKQENAIVIERAQSVLATNASHLATHAS